MVEKKYNFDRRSFLRISSLGVLSASLAGLSNKSLAYPADAKTRIGIIGLDTSHSEEFTRIINHGMAYRGFKVVAAFPDGSADIPEALAMKPNIIEAVQKMGVKIVPNIHSLLEQVDFVLLESNDGRVHFEQAKPVLDKGIPLFIDKPLAANYPQALELAAYAELKDCPFFSASALRFDENAAKVKGGEIGPVLGADVYTYAAMEPNHSDLVWYMIHGVELLYAAMGSGCREVYRIKTQGYDKIVGLWDDGRIGSIRGIRWGANNIAGTAFGEKGIFPLGPFGGYERLVSAILTFFETKKPPVALSETLEMFRFMDAAQESAETGKRIVI